ncbi:MAG TPA: formyltransferase family protein [Chitinophagaceae bacterium]|nr:formyltransferase family protein [Chitinophagaceae bacterium]
MKIALLTNSKLSIPAIDFLVGRNLLMAIGIAEREDRTEDVDQVRYMAAHYQVPLHVFPKTNLAAALREWLSSGKPDVVFVFTFPFKIPETVLHIPAKGFINFHFGILPQYRGADAIFWQIRNREKEGGISVHRMTSKLDRGPLYLVHKVPILPHDTYGAHLLNLSLAAIQVVEKLLQLLASPAPPVMEQDESTAVWYHRPALADLLIDWDKPASDIIALMNAANPWNKGAITYLNQYPIKVIAASVRKHPANTGAGTKPGTITYIDELYGCYVCCGIGEMLNLDILYCNDSFIAGIQFAKLGITPGLRFEKPPTVKD